MVQALWMVPGDPGENGLIVPRAVVEELRPGRDSVTVQPRPTMVQSVRGTHLNRDSATRNNVSQSVSQ